MRRAPLVDEAAGGHLLAAISTSIVGILREHYGRGPMKAAPDPGFWLVARREWRWLIHDRAALILIFGVALFAFADVSADS